MFGGGYRRSHQNRSRNRTVRNISTATSDSGGACRPAPFATLASSTVNRPTSAARGLATRAGEAAPCRLVECNRPVRYGSLAPFGERRGGVERATRRGGTSSGGQQQGWGWSAPRAR